MVAGLYTVKIMVNGYFIPSYQYVAVYRATVKVADINTPKISSILPISGPPGTFVNITGDFKVSLKYKQIINLKAFNNFNNNSRRSVLQEMIARRIQQLVVVMIMHREYQEFILAANHVNYLIQLQMHCKINYFFFQDII